jgi:DHA2 family methylenomycin A resistance protein-like MFS transporter
VTAGTLREEAQARGRALPSRATITLTVACAGFFIVVLDTTVVNLALPRIGNSLGGGVSGLQWVVDGYTIVIGTLVLSAGSVSDRIGAGAAYTRGLVLFGLSSAACGVAPSLGVLLAARIVQGTGAALMLPSSLALAGHARQDPHEQARAVALWATAGGVAVSAGPIVGGLLTQDLGWRSVFFINVPIVALALAGMRAAPAIERRRSSVDLPGQIAAGLALAGLTYGVIEGGHDGFGAAQVIVTLALGVTAAVAFLLIEARVSRPAVPVRLLANRVALGTSGVGMATFFSIYGVIFTLSLYFQRVLHHGPAVSGLLFLPMTILITLATLNLATIITRCGIWVPMTIGLLLMASSALMMLTLSDHSSSWQIGLVTLPLGVGSGFVGPCLPVGLLSAIPSEQAGVASGVANAIRQGAATIGVAAFGALFGAHVGFIVGMHRAFVVSLSALVIAIVLALTCVRQRRA